MYNVVLTSRVHSSMKCSHASTVTAAVSCDGGISLSWSKLVNTHLYHSSTWFNIQFFLKTLLYLMRRCSWLVGMHLWHSEYSAHISFAQTDFCRRLFVVPLTTFHRLATTIGDPQCELIFLFNTGRCGSTLLTQVFTVETIFSGVIMYMCEVVVVVVEINII